MTSRREEKVESLQPLVAFVVSSCGGVRRRERFSSWREIDKETASNTDSRISRRLSEAAKAFEGAMKALFQASEPPKHRPKKRQKKGKD